MRIAIDWQKRGREVAIMVVIGTFLSVINPYGATNSLPFWQGWLYWTGTICIGSAIGLSISHYVTRWMEGQHGFLIWLVIATSVAFCLTPVISLIHYLMGDRDSFTNTLRLFLFVWVISAAMSGVGMMLHLMQERSAIPVEGGEGLKTHEQTIRTFMSRLPLPYRNADLWAISSEDHYLRVHTSAGEHLFLERLATAIHLLEGSDGLQTHRSWWVAETGVKEARSQNGRIVLILKSGVEVPVSRTFSASVRDAGWV